MRKSIFLFLAIFLGLNSCFGSRKVMEQKTAFNYLSQINTYTKVSLTVAKQDEPQLRGLAVVCHLEDLQDEKLYANQFVSYLDIALAYVEAEKFEQAFKVMDKWGEGAGLNTIRSRVAKKYIYKDQFSKAFQLIDTINMSEDINGANLKFYLLVEIAARLAEKEMNEYALRVSRQISDLSFRAIALARISKQYFRDGKQEEAQKLLSNSINLLENANDEQINRIAAFSKSSALIEIATVYAEVGQYEKALQISNLISNKTYLVKSLVKIGIEYGNSRLLEEADAVLQQAHEIVENEIEVDRWKSPDKSRLLVEVADAYATVGLHEKSLQTVEGIKDNGEKLLGLIKISDTYIRLDRRKELAQTLKRSLDIAMTEVSSSQKIQAFIEIAIQYHKLKETDSSDRIISQATQTWSFIKNNSENSKFKALNIEKIARAYLAIGQYEQAVKTIEMVEDKNQRARFTKLLKCAKSFTSKE